MVILERKPLYSKHTGEQIGYQFVAKEERCDFSGEVMYEGPHDEEPWIVYSFHYEGNDPCWGNPENEYRLRNEYDIYDTHIFVQEDPFKVMWKYEEALKQAFLEDDATGFGDFLREMRAATALRLIEEDVIKPWQLRGYTGPEDDF